MYIPKINLTNDKAETLNFMRAFSFATIITAKNNYPTATHLPFLVKERDEEIILTSHFAKANEQWTDISGSEVLVIFTEPHAYISTKNYEKELNVPTWNYISVHAYGRGQLITETEEVFELLEATINNYEASYKQQWDNFPKDYQLKMLKGIVAFEVLVIDLQAKKKLSQNRTENEKQKIIQTLTESKNSNERLIADYMKGA